MSNRSTKHVPYDLRSHFITHSYLTLIENLTLPKSPFLEQSLESFLFICNHTPKYLTVLQKQIFDLYTHSPSTLPSDIFKLELEENPIGAKVFYLIRNNLSFKTLNKSYSKQLLKMRQPLDLEHLYHYNQSYIHLHQSLSAHTLPIPISSQATQFMDAITDYFKTNH
ncbi:MAG: hypothetical protein ACRCTE_04280 [Cellulosilyticaceae bacterium]